MPTERVTFEVIHNHPSGELKFWRHDLARAFLDCQKLGIVVDRWIPVGERLPETGLRVLAFVQCQPHEHCQTVGAFMFNGDWVFDEHYEDAGEPTHWMPLPEPPVRS